MWVPRVSFRKIVGTENRECLRKIVGAENTVSYEDCRC